VALFQIVSNFLLNCTSVVDGTNGFIKFTECLSKSEVRLC
jgi:hypothetical protein